MSIARVDIQTHGPVEFNEMCPGDKSYVLTKVFRLLKEKYFDGNLDGTKVHVNTIIEFIDDEHLTYFLLMFQPFEFYEIIDGHKYKIQVGIK